jgi:MFS transporter, ACS family, glucarate transporter
MIQEDRHSMPESDPPLQPSHVRYRVLGMLFLLSILTFLDRVCIGSAAPLIRRDLNLTALQMGGIFSAFSLAYGIFEIPSGWLGDRFGPRRALTRIVIWWSVFTALTGRVSSFQGLWITRFLFGAGEAGADPNSSCAIARWFPFVERARAQAVVWMASGLGGAIAPLIVVPLQRQFGGAMSLSSSGPSECSGQSGGTCGSAIGPSRSEG